VKKKDLRQRYNAVCQELARTREQAAMARQEEEQEFEQAIGELTVPLSTVTMVTPSGRLVKAQVVNLSWEQQELNVGTSFDPNRYVPGLRSVEIRLAPYPG